MRVTTYREKKPISFIMSVRLSACINSAPTRRICIKCDIGGFSELSLENSNLVKTGQKKGKFT